MTTTTKNDTHYTVELLHTAMNHKNRYSSEKEEFVKECLSVAAQYIQNVGTPVAGYVGLRIHDNLAIVMLIQGGMEPGKNIITKAHAMRGNELGREYTPEDIVKEIGANKFAKMLCDTLDASRAIYESMRTEDEHIDKYMKERIAKAKASA